MAGLASYYLRNGWNMMELRKVCQCDTAPMPIYMPLRSRDKRDETATIGRLSEHAPQRTNLARKHAPSEHPKTCFRLVSEFGQGPVVLASPPGKARGPKQTRPPTSCCPKVKGKAEIGMVSMCQ